MTTTARRRGGRVAATVLALLGAALVAVSLQPWWLAPVMVGRMEGTSGRHVRIDSMRVGLSWRLEPVVHLRGIHIDNAPWADAKLPLAALEEAVIRFSLRSLDERRPVIDLMLLRDGQVDLERQADGLRNWRLSDPENRGPGRYKLLALQAERLVLRFKHGGVDLDLQATAAANSAPALGEGRAAKPTRIALQGRWRALAFAADLATGPVLTFLETGESFPVQGGFDAGGARLDIDGRAGDIFRVPVFDADIVLTGDTLAPFHAFLGRTHDGLGKKAFKLAAHVKSGDGDVALSDAEAQVGGSDFAGSVDLVRRGERTAIRARLQSETTDVADLRWLVGSAVRVAAKAPAVVAAAASSTVPAAAAAASSPRFAFARARDVDLGIDIRRLRAAELPWLRSLAVEAALAGGKLDVTKLAVGVMQGRATGHGSVDLSTDTASAEGDVTVAGVRLESLLGQQAPKKRVTGTLQARARLKASGNSADAWLASATGSIDASLAGTISSLLDAEIGLQGGKILRGFLSGPESIAIRCAVAAVDLRGGKGRIRTLVLDTERTRTVGSGTIDLGREIVDVVLTPESKHGGLMVLDRSIRLHGPLRKPERELVGRTAMPGTRPQSCPA